MLIEVFGATCNIKLVSESASMHYIIIHVPFTVWWNVTVFLFVVEMFLVQCLVEFHFVDSFFLKNCGRILLIQQGILGVPAAILCAHIFIVENLCFRCQGIVQLHLVMFQKMSKNMSETYSV